MSGWGYNLQLCSSMVIVAGLEPWNSKPVRGLEWIPGVISSAVKCKHSGLEISIFRGARSAPAGHVLEWPGALRNDAQPPVSSTQHCPSASCRRSHGQVHGHPQPDSQPPLIHPDHPGAPGGARKAWLTWNPWRTRTPRCPRLPRKCRIARDPGRPR